MQAIHIPAFVKDPSALKPTTHPTPTPSPTRILIHTTHVSPTHVDLLYAQGLHQNNKRHAKPPFILGMDFAGTILSAPAITGFRQGDSVYGSAAGGFAEYISVDVSKGGTGGIRRVPDGWSRAGACAVGASGAVGLGCFRAVGGVRKGEWVLVTGATGGLGCVAVQIARAMGGRVVALVGGAGAEEKERVIKALGVEACVRYDLEGWEERVKEVSGGGVDVVYDVVGMVESCLRCCAYEGRVVIVGFAGRGGDVERVRVNRVLLKSASVVGYRFGEQGRRKPEVVRRIWQDFDEMVARGGIVPVIYPKEYKSLAAVGAAMGDLARREVYGRAVIEVVEVEEQAKL
ncbi:NAD(P)-binding protein [Trichodelitschia bisporula]|uniref:NAD(P)-binding protein n=1 Tax=Trichodelitschia bisporula TaxID=703511 RepID=A0A6G1I3J0_9PEZI|nr:NAD(P)-binding protein [Trichodelitschia bisporula]